MADLKMGVILAQVSRPHLVERGKLRQLVAQMFPPKSKWSTDDIPDLTGKICIVTGGNTVRTIFL